MRRYAALSVLAVALLCLGTAVLAVPEPLRGPPLFAAPAPEATTAGPGLGLLAVGRALHAADVVGVALLVLATAELWALAVAWERRRQRQ
jgi:hypothetical protein